MRDIKFTQTRNVRIFRYHNLNYINVISFYYTSIKYHESIVLYVDLDNFYRNFSDLIIYFSQTIANVILAILKIAREI